MKSGKKLEELDTGTVSLDKLKIQMKTWEQP